MYAINFYSHIYDDQLRHRRKTATIRLGDKSHKYQQGALVWVTIGRKYGPRQKLFTAIVDSVEVKPIDDLSPRDIERENPEFRRVDEVVHLLSQIYNRTVTLQDTVTVVHFSDISEE
ncbi:MAG: ASCH domain-containing protein [Actinomycetota bacterium]